MLVCFYCYLLIEPHSLLRFPCWRCHQRGLTRSWWSRYHLDLAREKEQSWAVSIFRIVGRRNTKWRWSDHTALVVQSSGFALGGGTVASTNREDEGKQPVLMMIATVIQLWEVIYVGLTMVVDGGRASCAGTAFMSEVRCIVVCRCRSSRPLSVASLVEANWCCGSVDRSGNRFTSKKLRHIWG